MGQTVVTARKVEEPAAKVPQSISVVDGQEIIDAGLQSMNDASMRVPNVHLTEFTSRRLSFPFVRGIGSGQGEPAVTTYYDGVPQLTVGSTNLPFLDVERIEFLRGPQGTLYGRNALGGLMHVITKGPSMTQENNLGFSFGEYGFQEYEFSTAGAIDYDNLAFRVGGMYSSREGFSKNDVTGNDVDSRNSFFGRAEGLYVLDENSEVELSISGERARDGGFALAPLDSLRDRPHRVAVDFEGDVDRDVVIPAVTWRERGNEVDFVSITALEAWEVHETSDFDFSPIDGVQRRTEEEQEYLYQELRWSSHEEQPFAPSDSWNLSWVGGVSGFGADSSRLGQNDLRPGGAGILFPVPGIDRSEGSFDDLGGAAFGRASARRDEIELSLGLRYDYEKKSAEVQHTFETGGFTVVDESADLDESYSEVVPQASAAWHVTDQTMLYTSYAQGFKAGGFNLAAPDGRLAFEPETATTLELGGKMTWPEQRFELALAVFVIDWEDMQLSLFDPTVGGFVDNAGESTSQGVELEASVEPLQGLDLSVAFGYTDTEFEEYVDPYGVDVEGNSLTFAPETTLAVGAQYSWEPRLGFHPYVRADWMDVGEFFYDPQNLESESYQIVDLRVGMQAEYWNVSVWAKNAFDEDYVPVAFQASPIDPSVFVGESGAPRMVGVTVRFAF